MSYEEVDSIRTYSHKVTDHMLTGILYMAGRWNPISEILLEADSKSKLNKHHKMLIYATLKNKQKYLRRPTRFDDDGNELDSLWNDDSIKPWDKVKIYLENKPEDSKTHETWHRMLRYWRDVRIIEERDIGLLVSMGSLSVEKDDKIKKRDKKDEDVVVGVDKKDSEIYWNDPLNPSLMTVPTLSRILDNSGKAEDSYIMFFDGFSMPLVVCPEKVEYTNIDYLPFRSRYESLWARFSSTKFMPEQLIPEGLEHIEHSFHSNYFFDPGQAALDFEWSEQDMMDRNDFKTEIEQADKILRNDDGSFMNELYDIEGITDDDLDNFSWQRRFSLAKSISLMAMREQLRDVLSGVISKNVVILSDSDTRDVFLDCLGHQELKIVEPELTTGKDQDKHELYGIMETKRLYELQRHLRRLK